MKPFLLKLPCVSACSVCVFSRMRASFFTLIFFSPTQLLGAPNERIWPALSDLPNVRSGKIDILGVPHR